MRRISDLRALSFVGTYYLLLFFEWRAPFETKLVLPLVILTSCLTWFAAVIAHNAIHCPIFRSSRANSAFLVTLTCAYGFPVSEFMPGHNISHHRHMQRGADIMRTTKSPFMRFNALNLLYFFPRVGMDVFFQNYRYARRMRRSKPDWYRQLSIELVCCWSAKALFVLLDWRRALVFVIIPHFWALYAITTVNYFQHDGCDEAHPFNHSRNFVGRIFNWFNFNSGFHGVHHASPGLHWSELPAAHFERFHGRVDPALEQRSLFVYVLRTFAFALRRRRFDGSVIRA